MIVESLEISPSAFEAATGWEIKPQGACMGEVCVPLGGKAFDAATAAERLGMAVVTDDKSGLHSFGPATIGDRALSTAVAPELVLNDIDGNKFRLSSLRGQKVVIVSWAPY